MGAIVSHSESLDSHFKVLAPLMTGCNRDSRLSTTETLDWVQPRKQNPVVVGRAAITGDLTKDYLVYDTLVLKKY